MNHQPFVLPIHGLIGYFIAPEDAQSFAKCFQAYSNVSPYADIASIGFNSESGIAYIALQNGVSITSSFGQQCAFYINDPDTDEEIPFINYRDALNALHPMSNPLND